MSSERPRVAGVRFRNAGRIFYFDTSGLRLETGEYVVVETVRGPEVARVVIAPDQVVVNELRMEDLKPILRMATEADLRRADGLSRRAAELLPEARRLAAEAGFRGRIDGAEFTLDGQRLTLSFATEERLDYREFVRRVSRDFDVRVDMRQMGARDRAKLAGGYGICGRELCCANWLETFPAISIRMAKEQELPLNPQKISGLCGRLLCCLSYEEEGYKEMRKELPRIGQRCSTPTGEGRVISVNILRRQITLLVDGQRLDVQDRDLGTVVRWDPSSKAAAPPPSLAPFPVEEPEFGPDQDTLTLTGGGQPGTTFHGRIRQRQPQPPRKPPEQQPERPARGERPERPARGERPQRGRPTESQTPPPAREVRQPRGRRGDGPPAPPAATPGALEGAQSRAFKRSTPPRPRPERAPGTPPAEAPPGESRPRGQRRGRRGGGGGDAGPPAE
jgi:cell fate regulator YaaT (PSP1 superfamily)